MQRFIERGQEVFGHLAALKARTVAAIHGACLGGGFEMALACDYRIATADRATKIGLPETKLGILPAWGGSTRLPRLVGVTRALDIILAGKTPAAKQALRYGMIDAIAPRELLLSAALRVLKNGFPPRRRQPAAPRRARPASFHADRAARAGESFARRRAAIIPPCSRPPRSSSRRPRSPKRNRSNTNAEPCANLLRSDACKNLMRLFFLQERARKSDGPKLKPVARAAVIGAGIMGAGIAQWLSSRGVRVILRDVDPQARRGGTGTHPQIVRRPARLYRKGSARRPRPHRSHRRGRAVRSRRSRHRGGGGKDGGEEEDFRATRRAGRQQGNASRHEYLGAFPRGNRRGHQKSGPRGRHSLFQSGAQDAAGGGRGRRRRRTRRRSGARCSSPGRSASFPSW